MNKWLRVLIVVVIIAAAAVGGTSYLRSRQTALAAAAEETAPTTMVIRGAIQESVSANGSVTSADSATLAFAASGRIEAVLIEEGDRVAAAQELARVQATNLAQQLARAEAQLATAEARLKQAQKPATQAEIDQAKARLDQAKRSPTEAEIASAQAAVDSAQASLDKLLAGATEYDVQKAKLSIDSAKNSLWGAQAQRDAAKGNRMGSDASKDSAEAQVLVAEVAVQQAQVALEQLQAPAREQDIAMSRAQVAQAKAQLAQTLDRPRAEDVALAEAQLAQLYERPNAVDVAVSEAQVLEARLALAQAQESMADAAIEAPFAGTVMSVAINEGDWAQPGAPAIELADTDHLVLDVLLDEVDVAKVAEGQRVVLTFEALPDAEAYGAVTQIAPGATQTSSGVAYKVEIRFDRGELAVKPGMTTNVEIVTNSVQDALLVLSRAVTADREAGRYYVTKKTLLGEEKVEIQIGLRDDTHTQVLSGVSEGDTLLLNTVDLGEARQPMMPMGPGGGPGR